MQRICRQCNGDFEVSDDDLSFLEQISPVYDGEKFLILPPDYCALCRLQRRMCFRNERVLYHRKCDATGANMITCFAPGTSYKVYAHDYWWSDKWDGAIYGRNFDFSKSLMAQMKELSLDVPHNSLVTTNCINSEYTNYFLNSQNSYLVFGGSHDEDVLYGKFIVNCKNVVDCLSMYNSEFCYQGNSCESCYGCRFLFQCRNCSDCLMIEECAGCRNCIACFGLRNQEFCFLNKRFSEEKFLEIKAEFKNLSREQIFELKEKLRELKSDLPHVGSHIYSSENCSGDNILNSKNCKNSFDIRNCEDCKNVNFAPFAIHCRDHIFSAPGPTEFCYQTCSIVGNHNSMSLFLVWGTGSNLFYCMECHSCSDCFGCVGLKNKRYCILNKQYDKKEYEKIVAKIIEHMRKTSEWGQFLDPKLSCHGHNESIAQEYFPVSKQQAIRDGFNWHDEDEINVDVVSSKDVLKCECCMKNFRIIPMELRFYRLMGLPLPAECHNCRHLSRVKRRNNFRLYARECVNCGAEIETVYGVEAPAKIFCETCYLNFTY